MIAEKKKFAWLRVGGEIECRHCHHKDWCTYCPEIGLECCMRKQSDRPSGNGGWIFKMGEDSKKIYINSKPVPEVKINAEKMFKDWLANTSPMKMCDHAEALGVDPMALHTIGCAWAPEHQAWAFPMRDKGKIEGIRLRNEFGDKWAVKGSKSGLFVPKENWHSTLYIVEGPTSCAAALTMGLNAIGRQSCLGGEGQVNWHIQKNKIRHVILIADNDTHQAGLRGACKLQSQLTVDSIVMLLPCKDIREFLQAGGTKLDILNIMKNLVWKKASIPLRQ